MPAPGSRRQRREFEDARLFSGVGVIAAAQREANPLELRGIVERHRRRPALLVVFKLDLDLGRVPAFADQLSPAASRYTLHGKTFLPAFNAVADAKLLAAQPLRDEIGVVAEREFLRFEPNFRAELGQGGLESLEALRDSRASGELSDAGRG